MLILRLFLVNYLDLTINLHLALLIPTFGNEFVPVSITDDVLLPKIKLKFVSKLASTFSFLIEVTTSYLYIFIRIAIHAELTLL